MENKLLKSLKHSKGVQDPSSQIAFVTGMPNLIKWTPIDCSMELFVQVIILELFTYQVGNNTVRSFVLAVVYFFVGSET